MKCKAAKWTLSLTIGFLLLCGHCLAAGDGGDSVEDFRLLDQSGASHELYRYSDKKAVVLISQGNGCPIFQKSIPEIKALRDRYAPRGIAFLLLNANPQDDRESIAKEAADYGLDLPILVDESQAIAESLSITRTAEAIVIEPGKWRILYRGAIDDRLYYGVEKPTVSKHYLADALDAALAGKEPETKRKDVFGCLIRFDFKKDLSYAKDVAPILRAKCLQCHAQEGGPAPMRTFKEASGWSAMIRETIRTGRMPPAAADIHVGELKDNPAVTPEEARTLIQWAEKGAPEGGPEASNAHGAENPAQNEWPQGRPDLTFRAEAKDIPASGELPYRYIVLNDGLAKDAWIRGVVIHHSAPASVHHNILYVVPQGVPWDTAAVKGLEPGMPLPTLDRLARLNPFLGQEMKGVVQFAPKRSRLIMEAHYRTTGKPEDDKIEVGLYVARHPQRERLLRKVELYDPVLSIPPEDQSYEAEATQKLDKPITVIGYFFHMHARGLSGKILVRYPDGRVEELLSIPYYDFHWQHAYLTSRPKTLPAGSTLVARGVYDNSAQNPYNPDPTALVRTGFKTTDEMLDAVLYYLGPSVGNSSLSHPRK